MYAIFTFIISPNGVELKYTLYTFQASLTSELYSMQKEDVFVQKVLEGWQTSRQYCSAAFNHSPVYISGDGNCITSQSFQQNQLPDTYVSSHHVSPRPLQHDEP